MFRTLLASSLLLAAVVVPMGVASAEVNCGPLTVSALVNCAVTNAQNAVTKAHATAQCVLGVPPGQYPLGLLPCAPTLP